MEQAIWIMIQPLKQQHRDNYLFSWIDGQTPRAPDLVETRRNGFAPSVLQHALQSQEKYSKTIYQRVERIARAHSEISGLKVQ